jgi:hypothetical protein
MSASDDLTREQKRRLRDAVTAMLSASKRSTVQSMETARCMRRISNAALKAVEDPDEVLAESPSGVTAKFQAYVDQSHAIAPVKK